MKNLLIIYNVIFFLSGNILFSSIHHLSHHDHDHDYNHYDCHECLIFENNSNYILDLDEVDFSNNNFNGFTSELISVVECPIERFYLSRAPPIS